MNKDVIYIDVEDDITAIIDKVKSAKARVVALVPPKRIGVLQSAVNLRLLSRAAESTDKRLVLISNSQQLQALAASARIPVAKNLQSKPEIPAIPELDNTADDETIDGSALPIGELARTADRSDVVQPEAVSPDRTSDSTAAPVAAGVPVAARQAKNAPKKRSKVPDFNRFRKKFILFGLLGALLIGFLVWAIWFAPKATIVVTARTAEAPVSTRANLSSGQATDFNSQILKVEVQETSKDTNVEFEATGEEERGEKAKGTMRLTRRNASGTPVVVPAGATFTSGNYTFVSTESVTITSQFTPGGVDPGAATVNVEATDIGAEYNLPARQYQSEIDAVTASGSAMSGGEKKTVKIVTASDMHGARERLTKQNADAVKDQLKKEFGDDVKVIEDSFVVQPEEPESSVDVGDEAPGGKAKLTSRVHYRLSAIQKNELDSFLKSAIESRLDDSGGQQVYETGTDEVDLSDFRTGSEGDSIAIAATGQIGPKIDEDSIKQQSGGKRYGEIQSSLESINGVSSVDVEFWPFWVSTVPNDTDRVSIEFKIENDG